MQHIAIFGGTFDPIHMGHLRIAETALNQLDLEQVIWIPSWSPKHKIASPFSQRVQMVQAATAGHSAFTVFTVEDERQNTYAINTLILLSTIYPLAKWSWILGLDAFQTLPRWYRSQELALMCNWLVAPRAQSLTITDRELCQQIETRLSATKGIMNWQLLQMPKVGMSSTLIRERCRDRLSIHGLVPESVRSYITTQNLYSK